MAAACPTNKNICFNIFPGSHVIKMAGVPVFPGSQVIKMAGVSIVPGPQRFRPTDEQKIIYVYIDFTCLGQIPFPASSIQMTLQQKPQFEHVVSVKSGESEVDLWIRLAKNLGAIWQKL